MGEIESRHPEHQYLDLLKDIMENGVEKRDHNTGMPFRSVFGRMSRYDLSQGFPLLTTKRVFWDGIVHELFWFMSGQTNVKYLEDHGVKIWTDYPYKKYQAASQRGEVPQLTLQDFRQKIRESPEDSEFVRKWGELPRIYGEMWRNWPASDGRRIDQLEWIADTLIRFPERKHAVMTSWNPEFLYAMAKPGEALNFPLCHILTHFNVGGDGKLSSLLYQRSCDTFLGVPFNIASYALLTHVMAKITGHQPGDFIHVYGDVHIYQNHFEQVREQMYREPKTFPRILLSDEIKSLDTFRPEHVRLEGYNPHPPLRGEMTVAGGFDEKDR